MPKLNISNAKMAETVERQAGLITDISQKIYYNRNLSSDEKDVVKICDVWVKEVAEKGDPDREIAAFIKKSINEARTEAPSELLESIFTMGTVGEFDDYTVVNENPKNTLVAYEAAKGGNVDRSFIDFSSLVPTWKNRQVETDLSFADMRKNGFKSVALLTAYAIEALNNAMFYDVFTMVDTAITGGEQAIAEAGALPTQTSMDKLSLYLNDRNPQNGVAVTLTKYVQAISRMEGFSDFMSESMKDEVNRYGMVKTFDGINLATISAAKRQGDGSLLIPDKKIFGIAGKIGTLDMRGEVRVYEDFDNQNEVIKIKVADFNYGFCITDIDNICKITMAK